MKILQLKILQHFFDITINVGDHKRLLGRGLCIVYHLYVDNTTLLRDSIPELLEKGNGEQFAKFNYGLLWPYHSESNKPSFYYLKRTRAIQETIRELKSKIENGN